MFTWFITKSGARTLRELDTRLPRDFRMMLERAGVPGFRQALSRVNAEFERARRYQHPLSVVLFAQTPLAAADAGIEPNSALLDHESSGLFPAVLAAVLHEQTRDTDVVTFSAALARSIVVMPETSRSDAHHAAARLRELGGARLHCPVNASVATFPEQGWTFEELIHKAAHAPGDTLPAALRTRGMGRA